MRCSICPFPSFFASGRHYCPSGKSGIVREFSFCVAMFLGAVQISLSQSIVSGMLPLIPASDRYAVLGFSRGHSSDDIRSDSAAIACFSPIFPDMGDCDFRFGMGIDMAVRKIEQSAINIGDLFEYEFIASGYCWRDFHLNGGYVVRPFVDGSITIGYISNNNLLGESETHEDAGAFLLDAMDYYCGMGTGIALDISTNWTIATDLAFSRNLYGTFTDRSGSINHTFIRFQIFGPLRIWNMPINCDFGWTYGKRDNVIQKELFLGAIFYF